MLVLKPFEAEKIWKEFPSKKIPNLYIFTGKDINILKIESTKKFFSYLKKNKLNFEHIKIRDIQKEEIFLQTLKNLLTPSLFIDFCIFVVLDGEALQKSQLEKINEVSNSIPENIFLILFWDENYYSLNEKIKKTLEERWCIVDYFLNFSEYKKFIPEFIDNLLKKNNKKISSHAKEYLIENLSNNIELLNQEIRKLILYVGERENIELKDVINSCGDIDSYSIFDFMRSILSGDTSAALQSLDGLNFHLQTTEQKIKIFGLIVNTFHRLLKYKLLYQEGKYHDIKISSRDKFYLSYINNYSIEKFEDIYKKLLTADLSIKSGKMSIEIAVEIFCKNLKLKSS